MCDYFFPSLGSEVHWELMDKCGEVIGYDKKSGVVVIKFVGEANASIVPIHVFSNEIKVVS